MRRRLVRLAQRCKIGVALLVLVAVGVTVVLVYYLADNHEDQGAPSAPSATSLSALTLEEDAADEVEKLPFDERP